MDQALRNEQTLILLSRALLGYVVVSKGRRCIQCSGVYPGQPVRRNSENISPHALIISKAHSALLTRPWWQVRGPEFSPHKYLSFPSRFSTMCHSVPPTICLTPNIMHHREADVSSACLDRCVYMPFCISRHSAQYVSIP